MISEYFKLVKKQERPVYYAAVVARSYADVRVQKQIKVEGWTYNPEHLRQGDRVLIVDDIFDTGRTVNHLVNVLLSKGIPRQDIRIAVHDYKIRRYLGEELPVRPDYFCVRHEIDRPEDDFWIHYSSHELVGLTAEEREAHYYAHDEGCARRWSFSTGSSRELQAAGGAAGCASLLLPGPDARRPRIRRATARTRSCRGRASPGSSSRRRTASSRPRCTARLML